MHLYLDIEATLSGELTVVGWYHREHGHGQLHGEALTAAGLKAALPPAEYVVTYHGDKWDLAMIRAQLKVDLTAKMRSLDLRPWTHKAGLPDGFKAALAAARLPHPDPDQGGPEAAKLWKRWAQEGDEAALERLLAYNRADTERLADLHDWLQARR
jgi:uncharacterized protein YprB with RNaseH-like and TPR domain